MTGKRGRRDGDVSLGDLLLAVNELAADEQTISLIRSMLGFEGASGAEAPRRLGAWAGSQTVRPTATAVGASFIPQDPPASPRATLSGRRASIEPLGAVQFRPPSWASEPGGAFEPTRGGADSLPPPPLFPRTGARAILTSALATERRFPPQLDVDEVAGRVANGAQVEQIPYRFATTLRSGAQILVDESESMAPFRHDTRSLVVELRRLGGPAQLSVRSFAYCPGRGTRGTGKTEAWHPPVRGVPVLVVSDFGIGTPLEDEGHAATGEWLAFARRARALGNPVVALCPFSPLRWPPALAGAMSFVHWSERATAGQVQRATRKRREQV